MTVVLIVQVTGRATCSSSRGSGHQHQSSKLQTLVVALSAALSLGFAGPPFAAPSPQLVAAASDASASSTAAADMKPDHACMGDLRTLSEQMQKEGSWLRGSDLGMLVLDTSKGAIDATPQVRRNEFAPHGDFVSQSAKIDAYWKGKVHGSK